MGLRGKPPTPTAILNLRGSKWPARTGRAGEPQPPQGAPRCPKHLNEAQRAIWKAVCAALRSMGILTTVDGGQLERYAVYFVRWRECLAFLQEKDEQHGRAGVPPGCYPKWSTDSTTYVKTVGEGVALVEYVEYPVVRESHRLDDALRRIEQQFGLTPSARARLVVGTAEHEDTDSKSRFFQTG